MASDFRTDYVPLPSGLYVPPPLYKALAGDYEARRQEMDRRFFSAASKTGKFYSTFSSYGNVGLAGGLEKPRDTVSFMALRQLYDRSAIDKMIILARKHQMRYVSRKALIPERETGWRVIHKRSADPNFENTPDIEHRCREMEDVIERVNTRITAGGFRGFLMMMVEDELVYDRKVMIISRDHMGLPAAYWTVDPTTVKPRIEVLAPWMVLNGEKNFDRAAERMTESLWSQGRRDGNGFPIDLTTAAYVQEVSGQICGAWKEHEISVNITSPVNRVDRAFYGMSVFEESLDWTQAFQSAFTYNTGWFDSKLPEQLIFFGGDYDPDGYNAFQQQLLGQAMGGNYMHRAAILTGAKEFHMDVKPLRMSMVEMAFPQWIRLIIAGKAACYRMDPRIINFDVATGNDTNLWKTSSREQQLTLSEEQGFHTLCQNIEDWVNAELVTPRYDDLCFRFVGLDRPSEPDRAELIATKAGWMSVNEQRNEGGTLRPLAIPGYPGIADIPAALLPVMQYMDQRKLMAQQAGQAQGAQEYGQQGGPGMQPDSPDTNTNAADPQAQPPPGTQPQSPGDVERQAGAHASYDQQGQLPMQKSRATIRSENLSTRLLDAAQLLRKGNRDA